MKLDLSNDDRNEVTTSLTLYFQDELDRELSQLEANFLLDYIVKEIAPFAYNLGVRDAQRHFAKVTEELTSICFEEPLTHFKRTSGGQIRRKPDR